LSVVTSVSGTVGTLYTLPSTTGTPTTLGLRRLGSTWYAYREGMAVGNSVASTYGGTISKVAIVASWEPGLPPTDAALDYVEVTQP
jgi:hypothetical protein